MTDQPTWGPPPSAPAAPEPARTGFLRRGRNVAYWQLALLALVALMLGVAAGGGGAKTTDDGVDQADLDAALARVSTAEAKANDAVGAARTQVEAEYAASKAELDGRKAELDAQAAALAERERRVGGAEAAAKASQFGDGVHEVGVDIQAGKYKTDGGESCYWQKSSKSGDIIANDLPQGPSTVIIEASVFTFTSKGCGTWTKTG